MNARLRKIISTLLFFVMLLSFTFPLASCGGDGEDEPGGGDTPGGETGDGTGTGGDNKPDPDNTPSTATYTVTVKSAYGRLLDDIVVYIHDEASPNDYSTEGRARLDKTGTATFTLDTKKTYSVLVEGAPDGYVIEDKYFFDSSRCANIKLASAPRTDEDFDDVDYYEVGDVIHDFTLTATNGKTYTVSEVLKNQQMLMINLWYSTCGPCVNEFPYIAKAYKSYNELHGNAGTNIVEIFAINDYGESINTIKDFKVNITDEFGNVSTESLPFPTFKAEANGYERGSFFAKFTGGISGNKGYPTTIFIDRAGVICCIEVGSVPNDKAFTNAFDHFTAANYDQKLVDSIGEFTPIVKPNVDAPSMDEIDDVLTGNYRGTDDKIDVSYRFDDAEFNWPYIVTEMGGEACLRPSNKDIDSSYSILYADVYMKAGDALAFEYFCSTLKTNMAQDAMVIIVNGKNIMEIAGYSGQTVTWETCFPYVAQHDGVYEVAFAYIKDDSDYIGEDGVFIRNLRVVDDSEIDEDTYIFRYAAENRNEDGDGYENYVEVFYNENDGYYHVGSVNGPLLLAQLVDTYSRFDSSKTVFERLYASVDEYGNNVFMVNGVNCFLQMEKYGNYAANSALPGHCPVNQELATYLKAYADQYDLTVGQMPGENVWLQLCCYYDAYGPTAVAYPDPIKGLSTFSAYELKLDTTTTVTYNTIVVPRGYLYKFTPEESGVYRITSYSTMPNEAIVGWIFKTDDNGTQGLAGDRVFYEDSEKLERIVPELVFDGYKVVCPVCHADVIFRKEFNADGTEKVITSVECSDPACIDPATEERTVITDLSAKESVYSIDRLNVSMATYMEAGKDYYVAIAFHTVEQLGSIDFDIKYIGESFDKFVIASPGHFTYELGENGEMGETIAGGIDVKLCDIDGCTDCADMAAKCGVSADTKYYHSVNEDGTLGYLVFADFHMYTGILPSMSIIDANNNHGFDFTSNPAKSTEDEIAENFYKTMIEIGRQALYATWGTGMTEEEKDEVWVSYCMDEVLRGNTNGLKDLEDSETIIAEALEWAAFVNSEGEKYLMTIWGDKFEENWEFYKMDDIKVGIYHGDNSDYTNAINAYAALMLNEQDHPERQGCVAVDAQLAHILQMFIDRHSFEGVKDAWIKFCYYYVELGA
jgi:thiol-disulfide isomerase/thioredoxin